MPAITIYLDEETISKLREAARRAGMPLSRYLAEQLRRRAVWSEEVRTLAGAWPDFPDPEELRPRLQPPQPREELQS
jgi:hypothetical protein